MWLIGFVIVGWFAAGTVWNVRRGNAILRWLQEGLPLLGERTTVRWLGSTAVELVIAHAKAPFEKITVVVFLEPRDMPWLWAFSRRRDTIIVRGDLRTKPLHELEALDEASWSGREALRRLELPKRGETRGLKTYGAEATPLVELAARCGLPVRRLSVRRGSPQLQLHIGAPAEGASSSNLFETYRSLGGACLP